MTVSETITRQIQEALEKLGLPLAAFSVDLTKEMSHGDYASNVALIVGKQVGRNPKEVAEEIVKNLHADAEGYIDMNRVSVAGPGFINFWLSEKYHSSVLSAAVETSADRRQTATTFGHNDSMIGQHVMIEFAQPNPFKQFHIGHLMGTIMGECYARLYEAQGATVLRANYEGDVGVHVACALYGMLQTRATMPNETASLAEKTEYLGKAYAFGATQYKDNPEVKGEINELNKKIYQKSDPELNEMYEMGKKWSLLQFDVLYARLGTRFDHFFFESEMGPIGLEVIAAHRDVFEESQGALVFAGEKYGLHTRVFINSQGLPTYEAKELGLNKHKFDLAKLDLSIVETANEINEYFKVLLKAMELTLPEVAKRTKHVSHGMLRLPSGKMSSRTGNVTTAEWLIEQVKEKTKDNEEAAIAAIKYSILRQAPGRDIIFDFDKSLSLEGDSGPYIMYAYTRARSVLGKAQVSKPNVQPNLNLQTQNGEQTPETKLMRLLGRFPEIVREAGELLAPQLLCTYLIELAGAFHSFYASVRILDADKAEEKVSRLALVAATAQILSNGLALLGIKTGEKM